MKKPLHSVDRVFEPGVALTPASALLAWLDRQVLGEQARLIRLPILLTRGQVGFSLRGARIGGASDAVIVDIGDAALGVGLGDRARQHEHAGFLCEGYWRRDRFDVIAAGSPLSDAAFAAITCAEVEGESHN